MDKTAKKVILIGAGPSGLACAYELIKLDCNIKPIIVEKLDCVGGLSRTVYDGELGVDIGGHRLYTKDKYVKSIWDSFLTVQNAPSKDDIYCGRYVEYPKVGKDPDKNDDVMLIRKRFSSIIYNSKTFPYPIKLEMDTFKKLGFLTTFLAGCSYAKSFFFKRGEKSLEDFMINRFGVVLYNIFFKDYTKKVWGVDASVLSSEWGRERIRKLSLLKAVLNAITSKLNIFKLPKETSLIDQFFYPKYGCSQLWNMMADYIKENGGEIIYDADVFDFNAQDNHIIDLKYRDKSGEIRELSGDYFVSSMPVCELIKGLDVPSDVENYALRLPYRDYILVSFYTNQFNLKNETDFNTVNNITPECWIYLQEKDAIASRIQIMNNWSPYLVGDFKRNYLISLEYFVNVGDEIWSMDDNKLVELALNECKKYNLFSKKDVISSKVIRQEKAYPAYWGTYKHIEKIKKQIAIIDNLYLIGRNGQHKYNNMDEAMASGIEIARKIDKVENYE